MIRFEDLSLAPGGEVLISDVTWHVRPGAKAALVGRNGTGKTTLIRAALGEVSPWSGKVAVRPGARVGYLPQQAVSGSNRLLWDEARSGMTRLHALEGALHEAERAMSEGRANAAERHAEALETFRLAGGFAADEKVGEVLHGLGFAPTDWERTCDTFSGGWQMRIALARLLLSDPDVALLDEPTNHLDLPARSWLAHHLKLAPYAVVVVSHDRYLLDRVSDEVVELRGGRLHRYPGNFTQFLRLREERIETEQELYDRQQDEIARLERFVERFKAKATKAAQARSRQNTLDRMDRLDAPVGHDRLPKLKLPPAPPGDTDCLTLRDATFGWPGEPPVLSHVDLILERGMRVAVLGPNGSGKSTLLHALSGQLPLSSGRRKVGDRVRVGLFTQDVAALLPGDQTAFDHLGSVAPLLDQTRLRTVLGALGLSGTDALRPMSELSGGERARAALATLVVRPANTLLLDEPTNHLDAETVEVLVQALRDYDGALLLVTHDRYVVEHVATHVVIVADGAATLHIGVSPELLEPVAAIRRGKAVVDEAPAEDHETRKRRQRERERATRRVAEVQAELEALEAELGRIDAALFEVGGDYAKARALSDERAATEQRQDALFGEWETLEALLGDGIA